MTYQPAPIDNSHIELSKDLTDLVEMLARNNHDLWAKRRMEEGWRYGSQRDETKNETPLLVPYEDLPESEKQYDRDNAVEALKTIIAFGGRVEAPKPPRSEEQTEQGVSGLLVSWHPHKPRQLTLRQYRELSKSASAIGECLIAYDIADEGLKNWDRDKELRQIKALALARMGSHEQAHEILSQLRKEAHGDEETLGLLARTYKDLWLKTGDPKDLEQAYDAYAKSYRGSPERLWAGINAATLAFAKGKGKTACRLAAQIRKICLEKLKTAPADEKYWLIASIAEAALILEDFSEAECRYAEAAHIGQNDLGHIGSTWRNARVILRSMPPEIGTRIARALHMPKVAVFAGHRIDEPGRAQSRFPNELAPSVKDAITGCLLELNARVGYSSAASGSDILFIESMQAIRGQTHIVLPCSEEQFLRESVASSGRDWADRFRSVLKSANEVLIASNQLLKCGSVAYDYANELLHGLATVRADQLETELVRIAVWDGGRKPCPGGTADIVDRWQASGHAVNIINPIGLTRVQAGGASRESKRSSVLRAAPAAPKVLGFASEIRAMIFADVYHFSNISEDQMPSFIRHFMGPIAVLVSGARPTPIFQNTWGDGLFFVFEKVGDAGRFALKLADRIARIDRKAAGLPEDISLRIALHVGPVYRFKDQIIDKLNYIGSHVNRAARIEPVTPPGQVYASDAFAALAALQVSGQFSFDYVGRIPLAKSFGELPMYHVQAQ